MKKGNGSPSAGRPGEAVARWDGFIPIGGSPRARLLDTALTSFGQSGYDGVALAQLARASGLTTGAIYHHFGSKAGLYDVVRTEVERRIRDRMEGAAEAGAGLAAVLAVGLDAARRLGVVRLLAEAAPQGRQDILRPLIIGWGEGRHPGAGKLVAGIWVAALSALNEGDEPESVRTALTHLLD